MALAIWRIKNARRFDQPHTASKTEKTVYARTKLRKYGEHTANGSIHLVAAVSELCGRLGAMIEAADTTQFCGLGFFCAYKVCCRGPPLRI